MATPALIDSTPEPPRQFIQVGDHQVELPPGVTVSDWALERVRHQNPRIRAYFGCISQLEDSLESNYAILHCSPPRLLQIWRNVRNVCRLIQKKLAPTLAAPSVIPNLDTARRNAQYSFQVLNRTVIRRLEEYPYRIEPDQLPQVRRLLCTSIGKIYAFLRDTFGEVVANDPRSLHDSDYYLSRRFHQDIEEAEWLYATVDRLNDYLQSLGDVWTRQLEDLAQRMALERTLPTPKAWAEAEVLLNVLIDGLAPRLKEVLALTGVRFEEMQPLDQHTFDIPHNCKMALEVYSLGRRTIDQLKSEQPAVPEFRRQQLEDLLSCHATVCDREVELLTTVQESLHDLLAYVPLWLDAIEKRRALMLTKNLNEIPPRPAPQPR